MAMLAGNGENPQFYEQLLNGWRLPKRTVC